MKINPSSTVTNQVVTERKSLHVSGGEVAAAKSATLDRTTLSTSLPTVSSLVKQAMQAPTVRQDKVDSLREAISTRNYPIDNIKIAGAVANEIDG